MTAERVFFTAAAVLTLLGLVMVLSASSVHALRSTGSSWSFFLRQLAWVVLGSATGVVAARVSYRRWRACSRPLLLVAFVSMAAVLVPSFGHSAGGAARWLGTGAVRFQPSELAKLALVLFVSDLLARRMDAIGDPARTTYPVMVYAVFAAALLLAQPDLGTAIVIVGTVLALLFIAGTPLPRLTALGAAAVACTLLAAVVAPYRWARMTSFLDPFSDVAHTGWQAAQGQVALASGGILGVGLGASRAKWGFLPAAHTDFIFAIVGEELGLLGAISVVALFAALGVAGACIAMRAPDRFGALLVSGVTCWIVGQGLVNLGAVVGLLPITGVPLPFLSAGGSALVPLLAATGLVVSVARSSPPSGS